MKVLSDLFAVFLFFITYIITKDMIAATAVAVVVGIAQAALTFWKHRKLDTMQWISLILIVFFGGATILLKDNRFIMWKPTVDLCMDWLPDFYGCGQPLCLYVFSKPMGQLQTVRHIGFHNHFFHRTGHVSDAFPV